MWLFLWLVFKVRNKSLIRLYSCPSRFQEFEGQDPCPSHFQECFLIYVISLTQTPKYVDHNLEDVRNTLQLLFGKLFIIKYIDFDKHGRGKKELRLENSASF